MTHNEIIQKLKQIRLKNGITAYLLDKQSKISLTQLYRIENELTSPTLKTLVELCENVGAEILIQEKK